MPFYIVTHICMIWGLTISFILLFMLFLPFIETRVQKAFLSCAFFCKYSNIEDVKILVLTSFSPKGAGPNA